MWVKLRVNYKRWVIVFAYAPGNELTKEERQVILKELSVCVSAVMIQGIDN